MSNALSVVLIHDAERALDVLIHQPAVDSKRITMIGHSEGTIIAPRVAIDNSTKVKNIIFIGIVAQNLRDILHYQVVYRPAGNATQALDKNHTGLISIQQIAKDPHRYSVLLRFLLPSSVVHTFLRTNNTKVIANFLLNKFANNTIEAGYISIDKQLKPLLIKRYENITAFNLLKCNNLGGCPIWYRSVDTLIPTLSIIGNVSKSTGILILNGENDTQTPVQQAFLLQQRLTDVKHPDHTLITYPNLGHVFYPSSQWETRNGPIQQNVLADLYSWLEAHSGLSHPFVTATTSAIRVKTS